MTTTNECTRSHPHELMDGYCELRTEIARLTNENARLKAVMQPLTDEQIGRVYQSQRITFTVPGDYDTYAATWMNTDSLKKLVRAIERAHGIGIRHEAC